MTVVQNFTQVLAKSFTSWKDDNISVWSAALAYYTLFSLSPLLLLVISLTGLFFGHEAVAGQIYGQLDQLLGHSGALFVQDMLKNTSKPSTNLVTTGISLVTLLLGASGVFGQLKQALNMIWRVEQKPHVGNITLIRDRFLSFSMILVIGFLLAVSLIASSAVSALGTYFSAVFAFPEGLLEIINTLLSLGLLTLLFGLIYKILPDATIDWKNVWIGAFVTSLLFTIGKTLLGVYLGQSSVTSTYGAAASMILILLWVYYSAQIMFFGAEFTKVYTYQTNGNITPSKYAQFVRPSLAKDFKPNIPPHLKHNPLRLFFYSLFMQLAHTISKKQ